MGADVPDKQIESSLSALGFAPVRVDQNRGAEGSLLPRGNAPNRLGAPKSNAKSISSKKLPVSMASIIFPRDCPPLEPEPRGSRTMKPKPASASASSVSAIANSDHPHVPEDRDALFRPAGVQPARLANPLSEEANVLKSTGIVTMAAALEWNLNRGQRNLRLFEIGCHYRLRGTESVETRSSRSAQPAKPAKKACTIRRAITLSQI